MVPQCTLPLLKCLHLYLQNTTEGKLIFMIKVVSHALTAFLLTWNVSVGQIGTLYWCTGTDSSMPFKSIYWKAVGVRSLQEHRKCGDCVFRTGRPDSTSWRVGMEIQWITKSIALLVFESHQWREKMTCRNVSVCHCVECQGGEGGDHTVPT